MFVLAVKTTKVIMSIWWAIVIIRIPVNPVNPRSFTSRYCNDHRLSENRTSLSSRIRTGNGAKNIPESRPIYALRPSHIKNCSWRRKTRSLCGCFAYHSYGRGLQFHFYCAQIVARSPCRLPTRPLVGPISAHFQCAFSNQMSQNSNLEFFYAQCWWANNPSTATVV